MYLFFCWFYRLIIFFSYHSSYRTPIETVDGPWIPENNNHQHHNSTDDQTDPSHAKIMSSDLKGENLKAPFVKVFSK